MCMLLFLFIRNLYNKFPSHHNFNIKEGTKYSKLDTIFQASSGILCPGGQNISSGGTKNGGTKYSVTDQ